MKAATSAFKRSANTTPGQFSNLFEEITFQAITIDLEVDFIRRCTEGGYSKAQTSEYDEDLIELRCNKVLKN